MSGSILNADMATLARWARTGFRWWREELVAMLPARLRGTGRRQGPVALFRPGIPLQLYRNAGVAEDLPAGGPDRQLDLAIPAAFSLQRDIVLPVMSRSDLRAYVALEADRLLPLGGDSLLVDAVPLTRDSDGRMTVRVAALHRDMAVEALDAARTAAVSPVRIALAEEGHPQQTSFDFAPALRAEGVLPAPSASRQLWWALVGFALLGNVALLIWRDGQEVTRLQEVVDQQQPAVAVYRAISGRTRRTAQLAETTAARRRNHDVLGDLAAATTILPDEAWVQRYGWDGRTLRLSGYMRPAVDVIGALRREKRFLNVRSTNGDVPADIPAGRPFDVTADLGGRP